jgi:lipoprotein signal peptidase
MAGLRTSPARQARPTRSRLLLAVFLIATTSSLILDQCGKGWAFATSRQPAGPREILPGLFAGAQGRNYGGIYSLEGHGTPLLRWSFTAAGFIALAIVLRWAIVLDRDRWRLIDAAAGGLLLSGMLGNQLDRLSLGYVRDYLILGVRPCDIFNSADVFMVLGALVLLISLVTNRRSLSPTPAAA